VPPAAGASLDVVLAAGEDVLLAVLPAESVVLEAVVPEVMPGSAGAADGAVDDALLVEVAVSGAGVVLDGLAVLLMVVPGATSVVVSSLRLHAATDIANATLEAISIILEAIRSPFAVSDSARGTGHVMHATAVPWQPAGMTLEFQVPDLLPCIS
jgi:hypothetical protein